MEWLGVGEMNKLFIERPHSVLGIEDGLYRAEFATKYVSKLVAHCVLSLVEAGGTKCIVCVLKGLREFRLLELLKRRYQKQEFVLAQELIEHGLEPLHVLLATRSNNVPESLLPVGQAYRTARSPASIRYVFEAACDCDHGIHLPLLDA